MMTEQVPSWSDLLQLVGIVVGILIVGPVAWGFFRRKAHEGYTFNDGWIRQICDPIDRNIGAVHMLALVTLFTGVTMAVVATLGRGFVLEGFALATAVVLFVAVQLPRLFNPTVGVHVQLSSDDGTMPDGRCRRGLALRPNSEILIFFDLVNLGMNYYKNCTVWLAFHKDLEVIDDPERYEGVQYRKDFTFQAENNCLLFVPGSHSMDMAMGSELCVLAIVRTPPAAGEYHVTAEISCETRAGSTRTEVTIEVGG